MDPDMMKYLKGNLKGVQGYSIGRSLQGKRGDTDSSFMIYVDNSNERLFKVYDDLSNEEIDITNKKE